MYRLNSLNLYLHAVTCSFLLHSCQGTSLVVDHSTKSNGQPIPVNITGDFPESRYERKIFGSSLLSAATKKPISLSSLSSKSTERTSAQFENNGISSFNFNTSSVTDICGRRSFGTPKIVGGKNASFGAWPWQISLKVRNGSSYSHICGAALINKKWAVTAAHCVEKIPQGDFLLRLGDHDESVDDEPYRHQDRQIDLVVSHPRYYDVTNGNDLALLRFKKTVHFQPNIIPVCLPKDNTSFVGSTAYTTGWGRLQEGGSRPNALHEVSIPVLNNSECKMMYNLAGYNFDFPERFICAGLKEGGRSACTRDSGGPLVVQKTDGRWLLVGITSASKGCARPNQPGVYTRVSEFRDWIKQTIRTQKKPFA